jgi:hypothetical protein
LTGSYKKSNVTEGKGGRTARQQENARKCTLAGLGNTDRTLHWIVIAESRPKKGQWLSAPQDGSRVTRGNSGAIPVVRAGTRLDVGICGSRRINGMRNFRQALASPHSVLFSPIRRGLF